MEKLLEDLYNSGKCVNPEYYSANRDLFLMEKGNSRGVFDVLVPILDKADDILCYTKSNKSTERMILVDNKVRIGMSKHTFMLVCEKYYGKMYDKENN